MRERSATTAPRSSGHTFKHRMLMLCLCSTTIGVISSISPHCNLRTCVVATRSFTGSSCHYRLKPHGVSLPTPRPTRHHHHLRNESLLPPPPCVIHTLWYYCSPLPLSPLSPPPCVTTLTNTMCYHCHPHPVFPLSTPPYVTNTAHPPLRRFQGHSHDRAPPSLASLCYQRYSHLVSLSI